MGNQQGTESQVVPIGKHRVRMVEQLGEGGFAFVYKVSAGRRGRRETHSAESKHTLSLSSISCAEGLVLVLNMVRDTTFMRSIRDTNCIHSLV